MTKDGQQYFDGKTGTIFRYLLDNGPATATEIAQHTGPMLPQHVLLLMLRHDDVFVKVKRVRSDKARPAWMWSVWEE